MKKIHTVGLIVSAVATTCLGLSAIADAADSVVVIPLFAGAVGNATVADVVKGKTFSSTAGKGLTGTLELAPCAQTYINSIGMIFTPLPAGTFTMGSPDTEPGRNPDETRHQVTLTRSFYMQTTEVTQKQWQDVIGNIPATGNTGDGYPLETVNWFEAAYFANVLSQNEGRSACYTLTGCSPIPGNDMECTGVEINSGCTGYRLPTEAEWEYAARATTTTAYANPYSFDETSTEIVGGFNANLAAMGWYSWNRTNSGYADGTKPVAQKQDNRWGLYDMHGNVREWCQDWYDVYPDEAVTDPRGPATGSDRVIRGGSWSYFAGDARSPFRGVYAPGDRSGGLGFRLALPSPQ